MIVEQISFPMFRDRFRDYQRDIDFSESGLKRLYEHLYDQGTEAEPVKLDVIALCCEWVEHDSRNDLPGVYELDYGELSELTTVLDCENGHVLVEAF